MYLSADDARSDFFLAAIVYVIGPGLLALVLNVLPFLAVPVVLAVIIPLLTTAVMPLYLMRYREGTFTMLTSGGAGALGTGLLVGAPVVVGAVLAQPLAGGLLSPTLGASPLAWLAIAVRWGSLAILAVFLWHRAEYAFRPISQSQQVLVRQAGVAAAAVVGVTAVLLLLADQPIASLVVAAGVAAVVFLAERVLPQQGVGERWWVWAPLIALALGPLQIFSLFFSGAGFLASAQRAAAVAIFGLVVVMALDRRRGAMVAWGAAIAFGLANLLAPVTSPAFFA